MGKLGHTHTQSQGDTRSWESCGNHPVSHREIPDHGQFGGPTQFVLQGDIRPWESWGTHLASHKGTSDCLSYE